MTSVLSLMRFPPEDLCGALEWNWHVVGQYDIDAPPGLIVDQFPRMAAARRILGQQDVARFQHEVLAAACLEIQGAAQRDDQLPDRRGVPGERAAGRGFLERRMGGVELAAEKVAVGTRRKLDRALLEVRVLVSPVQIRTHRIIVLSLVARSYGGGRP
ncbi:MAG TPA: hypothetical protein VK777_16295 [Reyranella sp.]|nr:hypothetical protein [Reyranella sp.]